VRQVHTVEQMVILALLVAVAYLVPVHIFSQARQTEANALLFQIILL